MDKRFWQKRALCMMLIVFLLLIFCSVGHSCHREDCPVCLLTATFKLSLGLYTLALGLVFMPRFARYFGKTNAIIACGEETLVALKVKLSD